MSKGFHRFLQREKVTGASKTQITLSVTLAVTLAILHVPKREEVAHNIMGKMGAEWHRVGLERPHFCTRFRGQSESWVAPAQQKLLSVRAARTWAKQVKKEELPTSASSSASSSACDAHKSRENQEISDSRVRKVTQKKTPGWAGATPPFRLSAAQKSSWGIPPVTQEA
jgi:hypothetical protein